MGRSKSAALFIGVLVCVPLLAMHHFGLFRELALWLGAIYKRVFILPVATLRILLPLQYGYYTLAAFLSAWVCLEMPRQSRKFGFMIGASFLTASLSPALAFNGILFEPFSGIAAVFGAGLLGLALSGTEAGQRGHRMRRFFVGRLSEEVFDEMAHRREPPLLASRREITVLSCRLLNHADLSAELDPHDLEQLSSGFLKVAGEFLVGRGGYLEDCTAQEVRVFFGFPLEDPEHAQKACLAALELRQRLINLAKEMEDRWHKKPRLGVALASGPVTTGHFGFREFQFFSAVGEALDFSQRLCAVNTVYGSHALISNRTYSLAKDAVEVRPMEMVFAPRVHQVSEIYELLAAKDALPEAEARARDLFWQGVVQFRKGDYDQAVESLNKAVIEGREDPPLRYFIERAQQGAKDAAAGGEGKASARHVRMLMAQ